MNVVSTATSANHFVIHGSPNWIDLHTPDSAASSAFYRTLFGWTFRRRFSLDPDIVTADQRGGLWEQARVTLMAECGGRPVGEIIERDEVFTGFGLPSRWYPHIHVVDLSATLRRVESAGGIVLQSPTDRGSLATVATVMDPGDALISLWQPRDHSGARYSTVPGGLAWFELESPDLDQSRQFYRSVFDWVVDDDASISGSNGAPGYTVFRTSVGPVAGATVSAVDQLPASWCPSFHVLDVDAATREATKVGAVAMTDPYDLPVGRQSVLVDPEGAIFGLVGPRSEQTWQNFPPVGR